MATDLDQPYRGWPQEELSDRDDSQGATISQMLDHGSISFGRFAVESLSWEKRSVFTHNRCQEELEKFKAPGLVAQKKAYFEEYYKRIRALKGLQVNQQTELTLDYGGDGSVSSQTAEEEGETVLQHESLRDGVTSIISTCSENPNIEVSLQLESTDAPHSRHLDPGFAMPCPDSSMKSLEGIDLDGNSIDALRNRRLDAEYAAPFPASTRSFKENDLVGSSFDALQNRQLDTEKSSGDALHMGHLAKDSTVLDSSRRSIEESELPKKELYSVDDKGNVGEIWSSTSTTVREATAQWTVPVPAMSKPSGSELSPAYSHIPEKAKGPINKLKEHSSILKAKESDTSVRKGMKSECGSKSDTVKSSQGQKHLIQKTTSKEASIAGSSKALANRLSSKNNSTSGSLYRALKEPRCNVTVPCPFSFATERRGTTSSGMRESTLHNSNSKTLNRLTSSLLHVKGDLSTQSTSTKKSVANGVKNAGLGNKRHPGEILKKPSVVHSQRTIPKQRDEHLYRPKAWSINLPGVDKSNLNSRAEFGALGQKQKEEKSDARLSEFHKSSKLAGPPISRTNRTEIRKPSRTIDLLLDRKKPRREVVKRWR